LQEKEKQREIFIKSLEINGSGFINIQTKRKNLKKKPKNRK
jgi:arginyl-tRNA synthetase